jgi:hypothetical protein
MREDMQENQAKMEANLWSMKAELKSAIEMDMKDVMQSMRTELRSAIEKNEDYRRRGDGLPRKCGGTPR